MRTSLVAVRLERTRDVRRELLRSLKQALPIVVGVAGPIFVAGLALLAWAGVPPMKAATLPWRSGLPLWAAQATLAAWPLWALRRRLLPAPWCVQLRSLPLAARALWASDVAVSAVVLAPLALLYAISVSMFAFQRPAWWLAAWPACVASLLASWLASCALGAVALGWQRLHHDRAARRVPRARPVDELMARPRGLVGAVLWSPWWRDTLTPGGGALVAAWASALAVAVAWIGGAWPAVPATVGALAFCALAIALTERAQRALDAHLERLSPWLAALPLDVRWTMRVRALVCAPMVVAGGAVVLLVLALRPWRALPLAGFGVGMLVLPLALTAIPSSRREAHVGLWALGLGLLTALGSELWN